MLERGIFVVALLALVIIIAQIAKAQAHRRAALSQGRVLPDDLRRRIATSDAAIAYFFGPHCGSCRQQGVVLDGLSRESGLTVVSIDATHEPELASALAVMTVPTTVLIDGTHHVRAVNHGFRSRGALLTQLGELALSPASRAS